MASCSGAMTGWSRRSPGQPALVKNVNSLSLSDCGLSAPPPLRPCMTALQAAPSLPGPATPSVRRPRPGMRPSILAIAHEACWRLSNYLSQTLRSRALASTRVTPTHLEQHHVNHDLGNPRIAGDRFHGATHC